MDRDRFDTLARAAAGSRRALLAGLLALPVRGDAKRRRKKKKQPPAGPPAATPPTCLTYQRSILTGCALSAQCCSGTCWPIPSHCLPSAAGQGCLSSGDCAAGLACAGYRCA